MEVILTPASRAEIFFHDRFPTAYAVGYVLPPQRGKIGLVGDPGYRALRALIVIGPAI